MGLLIVLLHRRLNRMHCAVRVITLLTLIFTLELGAVREVIEFSIDHLFEAQLEDGLDDTMYGLIFADVGAALSPAPA